MFSLQGFDENSNGILDGQEIVNFKEIVLLDFSYQERALFDSKMDGDNNTITKNELAQFLSIIISQ